MRIEGQGGYIEINKANSDAVKPQNTEASSNVKEKAQELIKAIKEENTSGNSAVEDRVNISKEGMMKAENSKNKTSFITITNNENNTSQETEETGNPSFFEFIGRLAVGIFTAVFSGDKAESTQSKQEANNNQNKQNTGIDIKS